MKGRGQGGKRYISIPGFRGYVTRKLNPERREEKRLAREVWWQNRKRMELARQKGLSTVVRSSPCRTPDSGRVAQARLLDASWNSPEREEKRRRNRMETRIRENRNLKKRLLNEFGSMGEAVTAALECEGRVV